MSRFASSMAGVRLRFEVLVHRYSAWLVVSWLLFATVSMGAWSIVAPLHRDVVGTRAELARAQAQSAGATTPAQRPQDGLPTTLPLRSSASAALESLIDLAKQHQLDIAQAEYQVGNDRRDTLESLQVTLPLEGDYPSVRRWIEDVLRTLPNASVDRIGFERAAVSSTRIVARVKLTLWFKTGPEVR